MSTLQTAEPDWVGRDDGIPSVVVRDVSILREPGEA